MIDLRSDTVTRPTLGMREAMARADVGDDVYGEDPTARELEDRVAAMFGHEAALWTPTGSLANLLAVRSFVGAGTEVLCEASAHIARAELGAHGALSGVTMRTWSDPAGRPDLSAIKRLWAPDLGPFLVQTTLLSIENTHNFAGGTVLSAAEVAEAGDCARTHGGHLHLDGARLWHAHVATGDALHDYGRAADVLAVCLSKGLGAPAGSLVIGPRALIDEARVWRKRWGAGMRQIGVLAAAGLYALDHHLERLNDDHAHARLLAEAVGVDPAQVHSNIVVFETSNPAAYADRLRNRGVLVSAVGATTVRLVTHLDVSRDDVERAAAVLGDEVAATVIA